MTVPNITITDQGIVVPPTSDVVAGLWSVFSLIFGSSLSTASGTPQDQLITSEAAIIQDERNKLVQMMNQIDPRYASGIWQDAIAYIYFLTRQLATYSSAQVTFTGLNGVIIPQGFLVQDINGNSWQTLAPYTIDSDGTIIGTVQCTTSGAIAAASNTITIITKALTGLDRVTNSSAAVIGTIEESRDTFEARRYDSVAANSKLTDAAVRGAIANLSGVVDVWVKSNYSGVATTFGSTNYPVDAHSILVSVVGGNDADIGWEALVKAGTGCSFMGNTAITVQDSDTYPQNPVIYQDIVKILRPTYVPLYFKITIPDITAISPTQSTALKNAILSALSSGSNRSRIAQEVTAFQYAAIVGSATTLIIVSLKVSRDGTTWLDTLNFGVDEFPTTSANEISIVGA